MSVAVGRFPPNPGSPDALAQGCICPALKNNWGRTPPFPSSEKRPAGAWYIRVDCPVHGDSLAVEERQADRG